MDTILHQICDNFTGEVLNFFGENKKLSVEEIETTLKEKVDAFILNVLKTYLEQIDQEIVNDKTDRKKKGIVVQRRNDKREQYTLFGQLTFNRTYFYDKRNKEYTYLLDKAVGLESYERISGTVAKQLVEHASETSYGQSSRHITGGDLSRQSVMKKLRKLKNLEVSFPADKRKIKVLYVNADEDHVSMQDGSKSIVPLISIHEGIKRQGRRGKCINPHYISSHGKDPEELWLEAAKWIHQTYDIDSIQRIYLHGDGARWIKEGLNWLPKAKTVLDRYHLNRAITTVTGRQPEKRTLIYSALTKDSREEFNKAVKKLRQDARDPKELKKISDFARYITNNWQEITIHNKEACGGSCTEGHVSHILSSRLSSRPMGWSRKGLRVMAELRAYRGSGGKIELKHLNDTKPKLNLTNKVTSKTKKIFTKAAEERFNNVTILKQGKVMQVFNCLRNLKNGNFD